MIPASADGETPVSSDLPLPQRRAGGTIVRPEPEQVIADSNSTGWPRFIGRASPFCAGLGVLMCWGGVEPTGEASQPG